MAGLLAKRDENDNAKTFGQFVLPWVFGCRLAETPDALRGRRLSPGREPIIFAADARLSNLREAAGHAPSARRAILSLPKLQRSGADDPADPPRVQRSARREIPTLDPVEPASRGARLPVLRAADGRGPDSGAGVGT